MELKAWNVVTPITGQKEIASAYLGHVIKPVEFPTTVLAAVKCRKTLMTSFHLQ